MDNVTRKDREALRQRDLLEYRCPNTGIVFQWRVLSIHLGATRQESLIEVEPVLLHPGDTHDGKAWKCWVPEPMTRNLSVIGSEEEEGR